jgi:hypothetical protein
MHEPGDQIRGEISQKREDRQEPEITEVRQPAIRVLGDQKREHDEGRDPQ